MLDFIIHLYAAFSVNDWGRSFLIDENVMKKEISKTNRIYTNYQLVDSLTDSGAHLMFFDIHLGGWLCEKKKITEIKNISG